LIWIFGGERLARAHERDRFGAGRDGGQGRHIAAAEVFGKCGADGAADFGSGKLHANKVTAKQNREKEKRAARARFQYAPEFVMACRPGLV